MDRDSQENDNCLVDRFTLACQSFLAHEMSHRIQRIVHAAARGQEILQTGHARQEGLAGMLREGLAGMLREIVESGRELNEMLRTHHRYQSDPFPEPCAVLQDLVDPALLMARSMVDRGRNPFRIELADSMRRLPLVYVPKYMVQLALTKLIWSNFRNVTRTFDTLIHVDGDTHHQHVNVNIDISPAHLFVDPGADVFALRADADHSLQHVRRTLESAGGTVTARVTQIDHLYRGVVFNVALPMGHDK